MDRTAAREANAAMVERISGAPAEPIPDGGYGLRVIRTRGRRTGDVRSTPLGVLRHDGASYLVSPQAGRDWVRNLLADPWCEVVAGGESAEYRAATPSGSDAVAAVGAYLRAVQVPWALTAFPVDADAGEARIAEHLDEMAVLRLDPC
jgi:deazaflavin-dependent oxidoreductase (nitroreductase family)